MDMEKTLRNLPSTAWKALKNYFAGLRLFFNRENWSHSLVFIITLGFFLVLALSQRSIRIVFYDPVHGVFPVIANVVFIAYIGGCGAFIGYLILGIIVLFPGGRNVMYTSRYRHILSPIIITGFIALFISVITPLTRYFPYLWETILAPDGLFEFIFRGCWFIITFLQVILLGYSVVKAVKWLVEYFNIPFSNGKSKRFWTLLILTFILSPLVIWAWVPIVYTIMIGQPIAYQLPPLPEFVRWLLSLAPGEITFLLWLLFPIIAVTTAFVLWRRLPSISVALAGFGLIYPALVYYYRFRVIQYFIEWYSTFGILTTFRFAGLFEMGLLIITFVFALLGAAKIQRNVSPNPFGLFAILIGTLVFALTWVLQPNIPLALSIEYFGMVTAALSTFLAIAVFVILPVAYGLYRIKWLRRTSDDESTDEETEREVLKEPPEEI